eukprot:Skav236293  [mRNA]  locus=scaffold1106:19214:21306:+ [translate_table: standard]
MQCVRHALLLSRRALQTSSFGISHLRCLMSSTASCGVSPQIPPRRCLSFASRPPLWSSQLSQLPPCSNESIRPFSTRTADCVRNLHGRLFYKRRPKMVPKWKFNPRSKWLEGAGNRKGVCTKAGLKCCNYTCMRGQYDLLPVKNRGSETQTGEWVDDNVNLHADRFLPPRKPSITRRPVKSKKSWSQCCYMEGMHCMIIVTW